jgi:hypothetical protein
MLVRNYESLRFACRQIRYRTVSRTAKKKEPQRKTTFAAIAVPLHFILLKKNT